ncbi:MAG: MOSC domain-containing protein [Gammaproteobacteria bacterium]
MSLLKVSELALYPVKSCAQITVNATRVDNFGLQNDRRWMVVDQQGKYITQRQQSRMCLIQVELIKTESSNSKHDYSIRLTAPDMPALNVVIPGSPTSLKVKIWHDNCNAFDCGPEAAQWLSRFLMVPCQLVFFPENEIRQVDVNFADAGDRTAFSDGFPLLLISEASLDNLNSKLDVAIPMKRFRPNIVVTGCNPFDEDNWKMLRIGELLLRVVKPCSRCVIPSIDTETGERGNEPTKTLLTFRKHNTKIFFGQNVIASNPGNIAVGDTVEIIN